MAAALHTDDMSRRLRWLLVVAGIAAIAAAAITYVRIRLDDDLRSRIYIPKDSKITPEIERLQKYVRIDTTNPPGNETAGARFLADVLQRNGIKAEIIEPAPGRGSVYARIRGKHAGEGLLLVNHIDVVPASPKGWTRPPFSASIYFNSVYARGTLDMKGIGVCELEAFIDVARSGKVPERDIAFLAEADEETGGALGMEWLIAHRPDLFEGIRYAINEGGITETQADKISYVGIELGTKMAVSVRLRAADRTAMQRARIALEPFMSPPDPERVLPEVREFFHALAPHRREQGQYLADVDRTVAAGKFWLLQRGYRELMTNIVLPMAIEDDARGATMIVKLLNLPDANPDARVAWLRGQVAPLGVTVEEVTMKMGPAPLTPTNTPFFALLRREVRRQLGDVAVGPQILAAWYNDSRFLRARGIETYGMWPFPVDYYQSLGIHGTDERVRLDWFMSGVGLMRRIVSSYAFDERVGD